MRQCWYDRHLNTYTEAIHTHKILKKNSNKITLNVISCQNCLFYSTSFYVVLNIILFIANMILKLLVNMHNLRMTSFYLLTTIPSVTVFVFTILFSPLRSLHVLLSTRRSLHPYPYLWLNWARSRFSFGKVWLCFNLFCDWAQAILDLHLVWFSLCDSEALNWGPTIQPGEPHSRQTFVHPTLKYLFQKHMLYVDTLGSWT